MKTQTTKHVINYKGLEVVIEGQHEFRYDPNSKMRFNLRVYKNGGYNGIVGSGKLNLKRDLERLATTIREQAEMNAFHESYKNLTTLEKIAHTNFAYARFQYSSLGNYYNLYWRSKNSPTGVQMVGGCSESDWQTFSTQTNNSHNYYAPNER